MKSRFYLFGILMIFVIILTSSSFVNESNKSQFIGHSYQHSTKLYQITVKTLMGKYIFLIVNSSYTIENLKHQILGKENIIPDNQILVFKGKQLDNLKTLAAYDIIEESIIYLALKPQ